MTVSFGVQQPTFLFPSGENPYAVTERIALEAESLGFDSFWLMDHFLQLPFIGREEDALLESWTTLAALAGATRSIRLGILVTGNAYRNPALLAKMGATVDVISNGRLFMGMGAAYYQREFEGYGFPFYSPGERLRRLEEAVQIVHLMWTQEAPSFEGRYYSISRAYCNPRPVQRPRPPILVGGGGEQVTLRIVARHANACNLFGDAPQIRHKLDVLQRHCQEVGRDYDEITRSHLCSVIIGESEAEVRRKVEQYRPDLLTSERVRQGMLFGTPAQCIEGLRRRVEAGIDYSIVSFPDAHHLEPLRLFAREVVPAFR